MKGLSRVVDLGPINSTHGGKAWAHYNSTPMSEAEAINYLKYASPDVLQDMLGQSCKYCRRTTPNDNYGCCSACGAPRG